MSRQPVTTPCDPSSCGCGRPVDRRDFLRLTGLASLAALAPWPAVAGPFEGADFDQLIPADKKLKPEWVKSLFERGEPTVYRGDELETIGMPVGGIGCGQLYLGGDGKLWHWDLFNLPQAKPFTDGGGPNYAKPPKPTSPLEQGFALKVTTGGATQIRRLDRAGFAPRDIAFRGQYPMAFVDYRDARLPVSVTLEAFSPFIPLNVDDSSLPATVLRYTVRNTSREPVTVELAGWLENAVCCGSGKSAPGRHRNRVLREPAFTMVQGTSEGLPETARPPQRADILFEDFENGYSRWNVEGAAFGAEPATGTLPNQQAVSGFSGQRLVNSFREGDATTGRMLSQPFTIERRRIAFLIGGGQLPNQTCLNLLVDGQRVRTATGRDAEQLLWSHWDVADLAGREARLEIVDQATGPWGHINVDHILFSDTLPAAALALERQEDNGSMGLAVLGKTKDHFAAARVKPETLESLFAAPSAAEAVEATQLFGAPLVGAVGRKFTLAPGAQADTVFVLTWFFPGLLRRSLGALQDVEKLRRAYATRFDTAAAVARYVVANLDRLAGQTRLWNQTWYDSTLPYWFLDRVFVPICTLATSTCYRFDNGRFYAFEGVYCCQGSCQHVWNYAQSVARIFPELERDLRQRTDFGTAWHEDGATDYRGECARHVAHDGQCGVILRAWREHQMAPNDAFLRLRWPRIQRSIEYLIRCDGDENGLLEGEQYNTLDASWFGPMAWISSFYIAALRAGEAMATEMGDAAFAQRCRGIAERGTEQLTRRLYNGEYFIHQPDPKHPEGTNTNDGCHIDQLMGQAWALQVGLPRIVPPAETRSALEAIWKYNFTPDVGPFREKSTIKGGRWYAMAGEGGVVMTTFPRGGADRATGKGGFAYYFNEVWTGQEHQLAAHMLWEGLADKALVLTRMIEDRHHARRRNPYNEVECSDHYTRAMASHGTFLAACGYEYHGPKGHLGFAPRLTSENFRAPFTAAEGWGTFAQTIVAGRHAAELAVKFGKLRLKTFALGLAPGAAPQTARLRLGRKRINATVRTEAGRAMLTFATELLLVPGKALTIELV